MKAVYCTLFRGLLAGTRFYPRRQLSLLLITIMCCQLNSVLHALRKQCNINEPIRLENHNILQKENIKFLKMELKIKNENELINYLKTNI